MGPKGGEASHSRPSSISSERRGRFTRLSFTRCSSANTLSFQRLEFDRKKLTKGPDVIRQACCHRWRALPPARTNRAVACALLPRQWPPQAHMRSPHIVEGLEEDHPLPQALAVFTEAGRLAPQRRQGLTQGQVHAFDQGRADREAQVRQALGTSTTRVLSVSSLPGCFCLTNCP